MPFLLLPLIKEAHGKSYPRDAKVIPVGTEFSVERIITKDISSIRSDIAVRIESRIYHFECESDTDRKIVKRVYEYDSQSALVYSEEGTKAVPYILRFPYSAVLFLEPETTLPDHLACELRLPVYHTDGTNSKDRSDSSSMQETDTVRPQNTITEIKCVDYAVPALKVQDYSLREISKKQLLILIPFTPIRFRAMLRKKRRQERQRNAKSNCKQTLYPDYKVPDSDIPDFDYDSAKSELTNFFREIILVLDKAVVSGYISESDRKYILALLRKALIRVFHKDKYLLEVVNHMTAPILELDHEKAARLQKELDEKQSILELDHEKAVRLQKELDEKQSILELDHEKAARLQKELDAAKEDYKALAAENKALKNRLSRQKKRKKQ